MAITLVSMQTTHKESHLETHQYRNQKRKRLEIQMSLLHQTVNTKYWNISYYITIAIFNAPQYVRIQSILHELSSLTLYTWMLSNFVKTLKKQQLRLINTCYWLRARLIQSSITQSNLIHLESYIYITPQRFVFGTLMQSLTFSRAYLQNILRQYQSTTIALVGMQTTHGESHFETDTRLHVSTAPCNKTSSHWHIFPV